MYILYLYYIYIYIYIYYVSLSFSLWIIWPKTKPAPTEVADEEAVGFRCFHILLFLGLRGVAIPDTSHQQWGDYGRAVTDSGLKGATLKLTLICACGSGPYTSGRNHFTTTKLLNFSWRVRKPNGLINSAMTTVSTSVLVRGTCS